MSLRHSPVPDSAAPTIEPAISVITQIELLSNKNIPQIEWNQLQDFIKNSLNNWLVFSNSQVFKLASFSLIYSPSLNTW